MVENSWAPFSLQEVPFWRNGMTPEEYEKEREYYYQNFYTSVQDGTYIPLWKQRIETASQK